MNPTVSWQLLKWFVEKINLSKAKIFPKEFFFSIQRAGACWKGQKARTKPLCLKETKYLYHQSNSKVEVYSRNLIFLQTFPASYLLIHNLEDILNLIKLLSQKSKKCTTKIENHQRMRIQQWISVKMTRGSWTILNNVKLKHQLVIRK